MPQANSTCMSKKTAGPRTGSKPSPSEIPGTCALRSKADKDVNDWLPPATGYICTYITNWTVVKTRWGLDVDPAEKNALQRIAAGCANEPITVQIAR